MLLLSDRALNQPETVTNERRMTKTVCCPIDLFPPPGCVTLTVLTSCTLFALILNKRSKCSHPDVSCEDLPGTSPGSLLRVVTTSDNQLRRERGVEDEEDASDKMAAAR